MVYSREELYDMNNQRSYPGEASQAAFLLGGIGTGNVSIGSRGELRDWEIFNKPAKGNMLPNTFFSLWTKAEGEEPIAKVLESRLTPPYHVSHGYHPLTAAGLPRMDRSSLKGEYPIANITFEDESLPVSVELEAYTPLIPLQPEQSGIPGAVLTYNVTNVTAKPVEVTVAGSLINPVGGISYDVFGNLNPAGCGGNVNEYRSDDSISGLFMYSNKYPEGDLKYGNMTLATPSRNTTYKRAWLRGAWFDFLQEFWDDFKEDGRLNDLGFETPTEDRRTDTGSLGISETLAPGETKPFVFILAWYFPNRVNGWNDVVRVKESGRETVRNYYTNLFDSSWSAAAYLVQNQERLYNETRTFRDALFGSSLPGSVIDALAGNIPVLRSNTCFWLEDGRFLGYEGCFDELGCCDGTCTHVWNYAQTVAFLFPSLERNMRQTEFLEEVNAEGKMEFRAFKLFDSEWTWGGKTAPASADGQLGTVMRVYREWKLSGDDAFLRKLWPAVKRTIQYAFIQWDADKDFIMEGEQHVTYDIEFYGPNPLTGVYLLGALKAGQEMAKYLGEDELSEKYGKALANSSSRLDEMLWNGEYYVQLLDDVNRYKYQHGLGCLSDQLLGQQLAHLYGLGYLLPQERVKSAVQAVFKHNFKTDFSEHSNCQRTYVLNDEKGLLLCSWPEGGRPKLPFVYSDEVWTGTEYHVATHLIYEGLIDEGLTIVKAVRERHDGFRRNPWNEVECGHHYVRSMSSWGLLIALSGFQFDMVRREMRFAPVINREHFTTFWSTGLAWGTYSQTKKDGTNEYDVSINVLYGDASGVQVHACGKTIVL
jgi:non-lysosomal glucosylceramidase